VTNTMSVTAESITLTKGITLTVGSQYYLINPGYSTETSQMYFLGTTAIASDDTAYTLEGQTKRLVFNSASDGSGSGRTMLQCQGEIFVYSSSSDAETALTTAQSWISTNSLHPGCVDPIMQCPWGLTSGCDYEGQIPRKWVNNVLCDKNSSPVFNSAITKS
jgi:hypothetical protein